MSYTLYIDDQAYDPATPDRHPSDSTWKVATNSAGALIIVMAYGIPECLDLDHDLGTLSNGKDDTVMKFLKDLADFYPEAIDEIKHYRVHSANPVGVENIHAFMDSWKRSRGLT